MVAALTPSSTNRIEGRSPLLFTRPLCVCARAPSWQESPRHTQKGRGHTALFPAGVQSPQPTYKLAKHFTPPTNVSVHVWRIATGRNFPSLPCVAGPPFSNSVLFYFPCSCDVRNCLCAPPAVCVCFVWPHQTQQQQTHRRFVRVCVCVCVRCVLVLFQGPDHAQPQCLLGWVCVGEKDRRCHRKTRWRGSWR